MRAPLLRCARYSALWAMGVASSIYAQAPAPQTAAPPPAPSFEVASIHTAGPDSSGASEFNKYPSNRYFAHNKVLSIIIGVAYGFNGDRIAGEPDWLDSQLYSIDAKVDGDRELTRAEMQPLVQALLEQRFHLKVHRETRMTSGYRLILAKGGPKLQPSDPKWTKPNGTISSTGIKAVRFDMEQLAVWLENPCHFPVVDGTGLTGHYDIDLSYSSDGADSSLPDLFTAIQDQLGLKLQQTKLPIDYLVIDSIDRVPTPN